MLLTELLRRGHVQEGVRVAVEAEELVLLEAVAAALRIVAAERPAPREAMRLQDRRDGCDVSGGVGAQVVEARVVDPTS